jgi:pimeloyl-ACP methyl ester carboxylesterase
VDAEVQILGYPTGSCDVNVDPSNTGGSTVTRQRHAPNPSGVTDARARRFRRAEQALWGHYGLEPTERFIDLASPKVRLRVQEVGTGDPVLLIGGSGGTGAYWAPLLGHLDGLRCLIVDRPGFGLSSPIDYSAYRYRDVAADILCGLLDALEVDRAHTIGASIGDVWALALAVRHPERAGSITLVGGGPLIAEVAPPGFIRLLASPVGAVMVRVPQTRAMLRAQLRGPVGQTRAVEAGLMNAFIDWYLALTRHTDTLRHERDMVQAIVHRGSWQPDLVFEEAELAGIDHPVLMVLGTEEPVASLDFWRQFIGLVPNGELHVVDGAGHLPWYDDPTEVGDRIRSFLP